MRRVLPVLALGFTLLAVPALADTPSFLETFDGSRVQNVPVQFPAQIGDVFVSAADASIDDDVSCDPLSTHALYVESPQFAQPFEVRFLHAHEDGDGNALIGERETFTLKLGSEEVTGYGMQVGFSSQGGFPFLPLQFGPAHRGASDADSFGEIWLFGEPTGIRYGNVFDSVCSGTQRFDAQVLVSFDMLGQDGIYFITVQSNAPFPQRQRFGPYDIPQAVQDEGYGACMVYGQSGTGRVLADGAECIVASPQELLPIEGGNRTHRDPQRR